MGIFTRRKKEVEQPVAEERAVMLNGLSFNSWTSYSNEQALRLSAVYRSVETIANALAVLPFSVYKVDDDNKTKVKHSLSTILNLRPEKRFNHYEWMKLMMSSVLLKGNAFAYIQRDENLNVTSLTYIDADFVTPMIQPDGSVKYLVAGMSQAIDQVNMIHLYIHLDSTYRGISVLKYASRSLETASEAEKHADNFFKSGANLSGIIKASSVLTNDQKKQIQDSWRGAFNTGSDNKVSVAVLPAGLDYQPISVTPEDSELLSTRKYNVVEISRFFGVPPFKNFMYEDASYNSLEWAQIMFLQDTILPLAEMVKAEFNLKLFKPSQIGKLMLDVDYSILMSTNKETEANYYKTLMVNGIISINEARYKLGYEPIDESIGDKHYMQLSMSSVDAIAEGLNVKKADVDNDAKYTQNTNNNNQAKTNE